MKNSDVDIKIDIITIGNGKGLIYSANTIIYDAG